MSISFVAKSGAIATSSVFVPASSYLTWDYFFSLYEIEEEALKEDSNLTIEKQTSPDLAIADVKFTKDSKSWTCTIIGFVPEGGTTVSTVGNRDSIWTKVKEKLPTSENSEDSNGEKKYNKKNLIKNCAKNRELTSNNDVVVAKVFVALRKNNQNWDFEEKDFYSLFGKGFWI